MKESYRKGVANHPDPESCATHQEVRREALTGAPAGWVLSPENRDRERRRCQAKRKATRTESQARESGRLPGVADPTHAWKLDAREPGDPGAARNLERAVGRKENPQGHVFHERLWEVGLPRS